MGGVDGDEVEAGLLVVAGGEVDVAVGTAAESVEIAAVAERRQMPE